jgi:CDP-4-dehydro-6-deoxyglucose reductase
MPNTVTLRPSGKQFIVELQETILEAALRHGLNLPYSCSNGSCGDCRGKVLSGRIEAVRYHDHYLSMTEREEGWFLPCSYRPLSDLEVSIDLTDAPAGIPHQRLATKVSKTVKLSDEIIQLELRTPRSRTFRFLAGQKAQLTFDNCVSVMLPIASCPCDSMHLRFHLRTAELAQADCWVGLLKHGQRVDLQGPCGDFVMNEQTSRPLVFIAWDTGFAQIQSLIDHAVSIDPDRIIRLYWLSPSENSHYLSNYCRAWEDALDDFSYRPVTLASVEQLEAVIEQILASQTPVDFDLYLTLPRERITPCRERIMAQGFPREQIFIDSV